MSDRQTYFAELETLPKRLIYFLLDFEAIQNAFQPRDLADYAAFLRKTHVDPLAEETTKLQLLTPPAGIEGFHELLTEGVESAASAARVFAEFGESLDITKALKAWRHISDAHRACYALRNGIPGMRRFWVLPEAFEAIDQYDPPPGTTETGAGVGAALVPARSGRNWYARYVPEWYTPEQEWPVVIALHGGWGRGDAFLWSWIRPAKTRGCIVLSPKSWDTTWTDADLPSLLAMLEETGEQFRVDRSKVLLTGLSDGGIFTYIFGLGHPEPFAALAAISANFLPMLYPDSGPTPPVYIMHGEADHMFPVRVARGAAWFLQEQGCAVEYHERAGYGHFYPPDENRRILDWFEARLGPGPRPTGPTPSDSPAV